MNITKPQSLNSVAQQWRDFFEVIPFTVTKSLDGHIDGCHSVYVQEITFRRTIGDITFFYIGQTINPSTRANDHKSELKRCKTTTFVGKSILYSSELVEGLTAVDMHLYVHAGGLTSADARIGEKTLAAELTELHGDAVLTRPLGVKAVDGTF